jgi:hypothetical protein
VDETGNRRLAMSTEDEERKLRDLIPEMTPQNAERLKADLVRHGREEVGLTDWELLNINDARAVKLLHDSMLHHRSKQAEAAEKDRVEAHKSQIAAAKATFQKSRSMHDAGELGRRLLDAGLGKPTGRKGR